MTGEEFSNGKEFSFDFESTDYDYHSRVDVLKNLVTGKKIIHLGCVDELETIKHRMKRGKWLHKELDDVTERCIGVDINEDGIRYIREELNYSDVCVADVTQEPPAILADETWDFFMIPEVLEHIDNPVDFLKRIKHHYQGLARQFVITVPNAFTPGNFSRAKRNVETINTDHRFWFTPYTLAKVVTLAGFKISNITMCRHGRVKRRSIFKNYWYRRHPLARCDIVMILDL